MGKLIQLRCISFSFILMFVGSIMFLSVIFSCTLNNPTASRLFSGYAEGEFCVFISVINQLYGLLPRSWLMCFNTREPSCSVANNRPFWTTYFVSADDSSCCPVPETRSKTEALRCQRISAHYSSLCNHKVAMAPCGSVAWDRCGIYKGDAIMHRGRRWTAVFFPRWRGSEEGGWQSPCHHRYCEEEYGQRNGGTIWGTTPPHVAISGPLWM